MGDTNPLAPGAAAHLRNGADALVDRWIEWIQSRVSTRTISALPKRALRNHIPPVLLSLASYLETPIEASRAEMVGHLELHAQIRLDQGYDIQELLAEFDGLGHLVSRDVHEYLAKHADGRADAALELAARLSTGLRSIGYVTVGLYRAAEERNRRDLARHLEQFGRTVAHEVRSPLHTIVLGTELLASEDIAGDAHQRAQHAEVVSKAARRVSQLVENVQTLALAEAAQAQSTRSSLTSVVQSVLDELSGQAAEREVAMRVEGEVPDLDVETVPVQIALVNLLTNAIKYSDADKEDRLVRISFSRIDEAEDTGGCVIRVEDNGIGIPSDLQKRVLQRGFRAHPELADGTGLGLFITRDLLAERGGTIELESREGEGTRVEITFRALESADLSRRGAELDPDELMQRSAREESGVETGFSED